MDKSDTGKDQVTDCTDLSLPLPEPVLLGTAETKAVAGGGVFKPGLGCVTCGLGGPLPGAFV